MVYQGLVKNGVVVFENGSPPEGTMVRIEPIDDAASGPATNETVWDRLHKLAGTVEGLPPDASENLDRYLYDVPDS